MLFRSKTYYQGSGTSFDKYDMRHIGSGDNTHFFAKGHHFSESKSVALFYADRMTSSEGGFLNEVKVDARIIDKDEECDYCSMAAFVERYYGNDIEVFLIEHIQESTEYDASYDKAEEIAIGLLTSNEDDAHIRERMDDVNYTQWGEFQSMYKEHLEDMLDVAYERGYYQSIAEGIYSSLMYKFDDDATLVHAYLSSNMQLDGVQYDNYANNGEQCKNVAIWNDNAITLKSQEMYYEPYVRRPTMR